VMGWLQMKQVICQSFLSVICSIRGLGRTFYTTGFSSSTTADRTECANEPKGLRNRSFPHGNALAGTFELMGAKGL
jgi:hypothetical protein